VLLNFWTTWCPGCLAEIPDLIELQKRNAGRLAVLGISLDGPGAADEHGHSVDPPADGQREAHPAEETEEWRAKLSRFAAEKGIHYPILHDPTDAVGRRFNGGELPTNVLVDADGFLRRRFVGGRTLAVFEKMIDEAALRIPDAR
jgi:thiol-disulfide isomerase/thioredoxin